MHTQHTFSPTGWLVELHSSSDTISFPLHPYPIARLLVERALVIAICLFILPTWLASWKWRERERQLLMKVDERAVVVFVVVVTHLLHHLYGDLYSYGGRERSLCFVHGWMDGWSAGNSISNHGGR